MRFFYKPPLWSDMTDADLVIHALGGSRDAFCQIVSRYQNLLCSLAYSSVGDVKHSEDLAQDTFVEAWKKLGDLQDPEKVRAWMCGILRFKVSHFLRRADNRVTASQSELDEQSLPADEESDMESRVISEQQSVLMWQVLNDIEETYREPLILFYREQYSVERLAAELDLSTDTAKQRLSRGRKLLKTAVATLVESGLKNTVPGAAFTALVMTSISGIAPPVKAAVMGTSTAKVVSLFNIAVLLTFLATLSGVISGFFGMKAGLAQARTHRERRNTFKIVALFVALSAGFVGTMFGLIALASGSADYRLFITLVALCLVFFYFFSHLVLVVRMFANSQRIRAEERIFNPQAFERQVDKPGSSLREYKTATRLFGVPLVHIKLGTQEEGESPAFGWVAGGSYAYGLLLAWGGVAIAPVSVGIISIGVVTMGTISIGLLSCGAAALGAVAFGASAIGYKAYSSLFSLGWESALSGGFAVAKDAALGKVAWAAEVNSDAAAAVSHLNLFQSTYLWVLGAIIVFAVVPAFFYARRVQKVMA